MNSIQIHQAQLPVVEYQGQRVVTLAMVDQAHARSDGTARRTFNDHKERFHKNEDFYEITQPDAIRTLGFKRPQGGTPARVILLTESGYLMLTKPFTDELSWDVQRQLVNSYFRVKKAEPALDFNNAATLRDYLLAYSERTLQLEQKVIEQEPKVRALARLAEADGSTCITDAAKDLQMRPKDLFAWLQEHRWIYRRAGGTGWVAYQPRLQSGLLEHKVTTVARTDGSEKIVEQVRVTPKGLARLAELLSTSTRVA